ncbi:hypothetical protein ACQY0O_004312 [Thecaphora frezii]
MQSSRTVDPLHHDAEVAPSAMGIRASTSMSALSRTETYRSARQSTDWSDIDPEPAFDGGEEVESASLAPSHRSDTVTVRRRGEDEDRVELAVRGQEEGSEGPLPPAYPPAPILAESTSPTATPSLLDVATSSPRTHTPPSTTEDGFAKRTEDTQLPPNHLPPSAAALRHASILSLLAFASIWGTLAREALVALNTYSGQSVAPLVWAQAVGCLVMGWAVRNRKALEEWYPPVYVMITTGFCGSLTTFSSWILEVFRAFGDERHFARGGLHNVMDALSQTGVTLGMSLVSLYAGRQLGALLDVARVLEAKLPRRRRWGRGREGDAHSHHHHHHHHQQQWRTDALLLPLGASFWVGSAVLCACYSPYRRVTFSLILSPPGAILRWYLSRLNLGRVSQRLSIPLGTLSANLLAVAVLSAAFAGSFVGRPASRGRLDRTACQALDAIQQGFCACLSTISTFVVEVDSMAASKGKRRAVRYVAVSWAAGMVVTVLVAGSVWWSQGLEGTCTGMAL